jgi:transposase
VLQKAELSVPADSENNLGGSSQTYVLHRTRCTQETISYCVKDAAGRVQQEGKIGSTRRAIWRVVFPNRLPSAIDR